MTVTAHTRAASRIQTDGSPFRAFAEIRGGSVTHQIYRLPGR